MARASGEDPFNITLSGGIGGAGNIGSIRRQASGNRSSVDSAGALGRSPSFGKNGMAKQPSFGRAATGTAPSSPYATNGGTILAGRTAAGAAASSRPGSNGPRQAPGVGGVDKSMLPGYSQTALSAKLEATKAAFKAAQGGTGRPLSAHRPASSRGGGGGGGGSSAMRASAPTGYGGGIMSKPRAFTCYLCGQQYGRASLLIHIGNCQKKWVMVEEQKPKRERRPLPAPPPELQTLEELPSDPMGIDEFNSRMSAYWDKVSLMVCNICGRSFRPDAFEKHAKVCTPDNPGGPLGMPKGGAAAARAASARARGGGVAGAASGGRGGGGGRGDYSQRPRAYVCYLCGQQYGSASLLIHIPQCYEKWLKVEAHKEDRRERREPPPPPPELDQPLPTTPEGIDAFNAIMFNYFNGVSLVKCQHCGRTMRPEALTKHQKLCTQDSPMKGAGGGGGGGGGGSSGGAGMSASSASTGGGGSGGMPPEYADGDQVLEECPNCGRKMRPDALVKHGRVCTADKPMKPVRSSGPSAAAGGGPGMSPTPPPQPPSAPRPGAGAPRRGAGAGGGGGGSPAGSAPSPPPAMPRQQPQRQQQQQRQPLMQEEAKEESPPPPRGAYTLPQGGGYDAAGGEEDEGGRIECESCGRRFAPEAYEKHSRICAKVFASKRPKFNMVKQRVAGTDAAAFVRPGKSGTAAAGGPGQQRLKAVGERGAGGSSAVGGGVPKWKAQSEALRAAMQNMRQVTAAMARGEDIRNIPVVPSAPDPSFMQCPHCGRRFNQTAAERHIPHCANTVAKPKFLKAGTGGSGQGAPQSKQLPRY